MSPVLVPEIDEAPAPKVSADVFAALPIKVTVPVFTVSPVVSVALVTAAARLTVILSGTSASAIEAQVRLPFAAMVVANWFAEQSVGFAARAVAVPAFPEIVVWSPVLVPDIVEVPVTARVGVEDPESVIPLTVVGVMAPSAMVRAGVAPPEEDPEMPLAETTETAVTGEQAPHKQLNRREAAPFRE